MGIIRHSIGQSLNADFENFTLPSSGYYNGSGQTEKGFLHSGIWFPLDYNEQFSSWTGFGVSNKTDTVNGSYSNQYSCYAGEGAMGSGKYSVAYSYDRIFIKPMVGSSQPLKISSFHFTNSTWVGRILKSGDAFTKKFGGPTGNDPDYFRIRVFNYFNGGISDSADVYLADFRFADNSLDYIVKDWKLAEFNFSTPMDSLGFSLQSTDVGQFGINTPTYFCLDNVVLSPFTAMDKAIGTNSLSVYPNPVKTRLAIHNASGKEPIQLIDCLGNILKSENPVDGKLEINISEIPDGLYFIRQNSGTQRILKEN